MDVESTDDSLDLLKNLGDRIEEIERTLTEDEDFCTKDIDATYQAAEKYIKNLEEKFNEKLIELKLKLDQTRDDNTKISKQNKKQYDDEIDEVNQLFSSGKHQEAVEKFQDYEKRFQQRTTTIQNIPKLYMNDFDINRYFSIDKPINIPATPSTDDKRKSSENIKSFIKGQYYSNKPNEKDDDDNTSEHEFQKLPCDGRPKRLENQQTLTNNHSINNKSKSPLSPTSLRPVRISTRLTSSPSTKSLPVSEHNRTTPLSAPVTNINSRENIMNHVQPRSTPASPNIVPSFSQRRMVTAKNSKTEALTTIRVLYYQHDPKISLLITCNKTYFIVFKIQTDLLTSRGSLFAIERSNRIEQDLYWRSHSITSIGFIDNNHLYIFTEYDFTIYSLNKFSAYNSWTLTDNNNNGKQSRGIGTVYDKYVYHIYINEDSHRILSICELASMEHVYDYNLSIDFSDVNRFLHICINNQTINILVEMKSLQYAVISLFKTDHLSVESSRLIPLSYANNPLTICSIYIHYLKKYFLFVNDPSAKIIHILTDEKYLQSYAITAHALSYNEENCELIFVSNDGIYSININEHESFFRDIIQINCQIDLYLFFVFVF